MTQINVDVRELKRLADKLGDTSKLKRAAENALSNASSMVADYAKTNHIFTSRTFKLENSIFVNVKGLSSDIFTPIDGQLGTAYAGWIYNGTRTTPLGNTAKWNNGKGDQYIEKAYTKNQKKFLEIMQNDIVEQIEDFI